MPYTNIQIKRAFNSLRLYALYGIVVTMVFTLLVPNSICIIALLTIWLFEQNYQQKWDLLKKDKLFLAYSLYFLLQLVGLFYAHDFYEGGWCHTERKLGFFFLPLIFCSSSFVNQEIQKKVMFCLSITLTIASLFCLAKATYGYAFTGNSGLFFYHQLVSPLGQHAVYFSVYIFISLVFLIQSNDDFIWRKQKRTIKSLWVGYLIVIIILLSSKLIISLSVLFFLYFFLRSFFKKTNRRRALTVALILVFLSGAFFFINNPVKKRFDDLLKGNFALTQKEVYSPAEYFNGFEFRLLLWRFTYEILKDNHAFVLGVGQSNTQSFLKKKYLSMNMYAGEKGNGEGYLQYNCHNQFLEISLQSGIIGLIVLIYWCYIMGIKTFRKKNIVLSAMVIITFIFFFTESVFERQYGMLLCTFFPLLFLYPDSEKKE